MGDAGRIFGDDADSTLLDASLPGEKTPGDAIGDSTGDESPLPGDPLDVVGRGGEFKWDGGGLSGLAAVIGLAGFDGLASCDELAGFDGLASFDGLACFTGLSRVGVGTGKSSLSSASSSWTSSSSSS